MPTKFKPPKTLGACADLLYKMRADRLLKQKEVELMEENEKILKEHIIQTLPKSQASGVSGKIANVAVVSKAIAQVKDWDKFYKHILKTKQFDLMQKRVSDTAVQERWEAGKEVPGVESFNVTTVSVTKV